ncbi:MAG: cytochrome C oxidase subunit IV family protein [Deltaproteobacteria bacterium]|nr:cytochrome C oxidase subunit IV family protein [Deltaproteobacteria bacterium]
MSQHRSREGGDHIKNYLKVWVALLILTAMTVFTALSFHLGILNIFIAMLIATIKGSLVCLYFMHLIEDNRLNQVVFVSAFFFLALFVGLTLSDVLVR